MRFAGVADLVGSGFVPRVVIVGSGPAGITLALRLQQRKLPCLIVEAGGMEPSMASQALYRGTVVGDAYFDLDAARLRQFGGTSGHWSGWCRTLDPIDLAERPEIGRAGWPIDPAELAGHADAAREILQLKPVPPDQPASPDLDEVSIAFSPPVRFGTTYRREIEQSASIGLLPDTALTDIVPARGRIDAVELAARDGTRHRLRVEQLCLATGGIENSRLLLWANERHQGGAVPRAAALGRHWIEHIVYNVADALLFDGAEAQFARRRFFATSASTARAHAVTRSRMWLYGVERNEPVVKSLLRDAICAAPNLFDRLYRAAGRELRCGAPLRMGWEQLPVADNRIELGRETDALGLPRVRLHWRKTEMERKAALVGARLFGEWLIRQQLGRLRIRPWLLEGGPWPLDDQGAGRHHMGGTRMAASADAGVVDANCRVHGVDNLYVAGSSVFPSGGHANPTMTIVQLALRLGDHLADRLAGKAGLPVEAAREGSALRLPARDPAQPRPGIRAEAGIRLALAKRGP